MAVGDMDDRLIITIDYETAPGQPTSVNCLRLARDYKDVTEGRVLVVLEHPAGHYYCNAHRVLEVCSRWGRAGILAAPSSLYKAIRRLCTIS
jgi:hypothetical protein